MITPRHAPQRIRTRVASRQATLARFVLLSMLLHAAVIALFGTSHGGGPGRGERALEDVLDVTLRRLSVPPGAGTTPNPGPGNDARRSVSPRTDGALQTPAAPQRSEGGPANPPAAAGANAADRATAEPPRALPGPQAPAPSRTQPGDTLPRIDLRAPQEVDKPLAPPMNSPPSIERLAPPPPAPPMAAPFQVAPPTSPAPIERLASPASQRALASPVEMPPRTQMLVPNVPVERLAAPAIARRLAAPVEMPPRTQMLVPNVPVERLAPPAIARELAAPVELAPPPQTRVPIAPVERLAAPA
ncbi:MAG: hypothetical protein ACREYB_09180, partial [Casimicrobiaceae bacterium]